MEHIILVKKMNDFAINIEKVSKSFGSVVAIDDFSINIKKGEIVALIGPNGAGKTTLLNVISGFIMPEKGKILINGDVNIKGLKPYEVAHLGLYRTFQDLKNVKYMNVIDNVMLSFPGQSGENLFNLFFDSKKIKNQEESNHNDALHLIAELGLKDDVLTMLGGLSYGQQKIISIISAILSKSNILLLDEPFTGIALKTVKKILKIICDLSERGTTIIFVEHNMHIVREISTKVIFMNLGKKVCYGSFSQIINDKRVFDLYIG